MKKIAIGLAILFVLVAALSVQAWLPLFLPMKHVAGNRDYCDRCGMMISSRSEYWHDAKAQAVTVETLEVTDLSRWFVDRFGAGCEHHWVRFRTWGHSFLSAADRNVLEIGRETGCSLTPELLHLDEDDLAQLQKLFDEDPAACREYIHGQLKHQERADLSSPVEPRPGPEGPAI